MTKQLVEFELEDGTSVVFETDRDESDGSIERISRGGDENDQPKKAVQTFNKVAKSIQPAAQIVLDSLKEMNSPKEIQLEFGLKFGAKTGVILASADTEVNFKVTVKWENS